MEFQRDFGFIDAGLILAFAVLYLIFAFRIHRINQSLGRNSLKPILKLSLRVVYFSLMVIALLGPSFGEQKKKVKSEGKDIFVAIDLSKSMDAEDISPSRLEKVKFELEKLVRAFNSDRIGLIMFTSEAFLQSPLTFDHKHLLNLSISSLSTNQISNTGTDFAPPLRMALEKHLAESENATGKQSKNSKVILLISDGEDFGDETASIASDIKEEGIKLFTLGIGTEKGGKIPEGYRYLTDKTGGEVVSKLDAKSLEKLADMTGGDYFQISDGRNDVAKLITAISKIKGEFRDARDIDTSANRYFYFLSIALILMISDVLITVKIIRI